MDSHEHFGLSIPADRVIGNRRLNDRLPESTTFGPFVPDEMRIGEIDTDCSSHLPFSRSGDSRMR